MAAKKTTTRKKSWRTTVAKAQGHITRARAELAVALGLVKPGQGKQMYKGMGQLDEAFKTLNAARQMPRPKTPRKKK